MCQECITAIDAIALVVRIVVGIHEDAIADLRAIDITQINAAGIVGIVEGTVIK
jgi:hypothetical protein